MTAERDIVGFVIPFAAGASAAVLFFASGLTSCTCLAAILILFTAGCLSILTYSIRGSLNHNILWLATLLMPFCCGILTGLSGHILSVSDIPDAGFISSRASRFCSWMKDTIQTIPFGSEKSNSLVTALITGDRSALSKETVDAFRTSGASHILALSGLHLGIIYGGLRLILPRGGSSMISRFLSAALIVSICGFYTLATGACASITRAFLFILLGETASLSGRTRSTRTILWTALFLQLLADPLSITDVGFQLSYAAMFGIAYILPLFNEMWPAQKGLAFKGLRWIWASASMSMACQLTTGPVAWLYFGTFPKYFLLTNLIALPLVGLIITLSVMLIMLQGCGICPDILVRVTELLINGMCRSLEIIASI